jgi:hypothetical protein
MNQQDYTTTIQSPASAKETIEAIDRVGAWWTSSFKGAAQKIGDTFNVRFGETSVTFQVVEHTATRIVWHVTDSLLPWLKDKTEWTGTDVVWEIAIDGDKTKVQMTHKGLLPKVECYEGCEKGWNFYVRESLRKLLVDGEGLPDGKPRAQA